MGFFAKLKEKLKKTKEAIAYKLNKLFTGGVLTDDFYDELEMALISSDIGAETVDKLMEDLRDVIDEKHIRDTASVKNELKELMVGILESNELTEYEYPLVLLVAGVNGVGNT
ncbi:MAG: signal recognition particle receptor subunit alpha, partial [Clostridiales bacterium]|nr:signal recognition particle receptor subunit alpha [Clostridiales bacterium]